MKGVDGSHRRQVVLSTPYPNVITRHWSVTTGMLDDRERTMICACRATGQIYGWCSTNTSYPVVWTSRRWTQLPGSSKSMQPGLPTPGSKLDWATPSTRMGPTTPMVSGSPLGQWRVRYRRLLNNWAVPYLSHDMTNPSRPTTRGQGQDPAWLWGSTAPTAMSPAAHGSASGQTSTRAPNRLQCQRPAAGMVGYVGVIGWFTSDHTWRSWMWRP